MADALFRPRAGLTMRTVDGEAVVLDKVTGSVHHLNPTASFIWSQLDGKTPNGEIVQRVVRTFSVDAVVAREDVQRLVDQFRALQLLEPSVDGVEESK